MQRCTDYGLHSCMMQLCTHVLKALADMCIYFLASKYYCNRFFICICIDHQYETHKFILQHMSRFCSSQSHSFTCGSSTDLVLESQFY